MSPRKIGTPCPAWLLGDGRSTDFNLFPTVGRRESAGAPTAGIEVPACPMPVGAAPPRAPVPPGRAEAGRLTQHSKAPTTDPVDAEPTIKSAPNGMDRISPAPMCGWVRTLILVAATAGPG
jgi:hypothetical protein